ncbi:MAG TPA: hypothetical protein VGP76_11720 [Planctomycetaceae bacterium]|jgi:hypothetical protein|nr:hypothetical protein [Planctomycetaceae bacterium]
MKLAVPNLKTLDYKQLGIDHGEKLAIGIVGLLLLFVLWSTRWAKPIAESPTELIEEAKSTDEKIKKQAWPEADAKALKTGTDLRGRATALLTPLELNPWVLPIALNKPYHPDRTLITKPKWLAVKNLIADAQAVDLEMDPKVARLNEGFKKLKKDDPSKEKAKKGEKKDKEPEDKPEIPEELRRTSSGQGQPGAYGGLGGFGGLGRMGGGRGRMGGMGRGGSNPGGTVENMGKRRGRRGRKSGDEETSNDAVAKQEKKEKEKPVGRGYHVVAVRGVFPLREQVTEMKRAMGNSVSAHEAQEAIRMQDFKLERQTALPGPDPWRGKWDPVDRESTLEMFHNDIFNFAPETVADGIIDRHICMPLPIRLIGEWGRLATHPDVKDFVLSPDEVQAQLEYQRKVIEKMQEEDKKKKKTVDKGGFAEFTDDPRKVQKRGAAAGPDENSKPIQQQILDELAKAPKERPSEEQINAKLTEYITKHATPQDHLLLFRYLDFNVEPGKIYRYRVQLVVENPFKNRHAEEVNDPSLIERDTRETEFSEPTRPVYVPEDAKFFVTRVDGHAGHSQLPFAKVDLYQWFASTGTVVNKEISAQIGQLLGGLHIADVLNPAEGVSERERVPFSTNDALVDVAQGFSLDTGLHKELLSEIASSETKDKTEKKSTSDKERKTGTMVPDVLVFVDSNGALRVIDALDQEEDHQKEKQRYNFQNGQWEDLTKPADDKLGRGRLGSGKKQKRGGKSGGGTGAGANAGS